MSTTRVRHPLFARFYAWISPRQEQGGIAEYRDKLLAGLTGRVIEVGAGNGLNFSHYPPQVTQVVAVEPEPHLRDVARRAAEEAPVKVEVVDGIAERLPVTDAAFDAAVASAMLCSVSDQRAALAEMFRAVRPGGKLHFFEHVRADSPRLARVQGFLDATVWPRLMGGCHLGRDTEPAITAAGFQIERVEHFRLPNGPAAPNILGVALRPGTDQE